MRITDITVTRCTLGKVDRPRFAAVGPKFTEQTFSYLEISTDEGPSGIALGGARAAGSLEALKARLVGEDPLDAARLWSKMFGAPRVVKGSDLSAIGSADIALWDLRGKILGQPVWRLLGGFRSRVPVYCSGGFYREGQDRDDLVKECASYVDLGYRALKMRVGWRGISFSEDVARVAAVRDAIGPDVQLMIDANSAWSTAHEAARFIRAVEGNDLSWVEEPVFPDDYEGAAELCRSFDTPIAQGEREHTRWGYRELLEHKAADIVQPDPEWCGGLTEFMRIAALASAHHVPVAPHGTHMIGAHACAAIDNGLVAEGCDEGFFPWQREFVEPYPLVDAELVLPDRPGFGYVMDEDLIAKTTY